MRSEVDAASAPPEQPIRVAGRNVATYRWRPELPPTVAPRPYLHPVRTLGGVEVTEVGPADHVHHLGVGVAIADVGGSNFWGGRTYVPERGPAWCDDHGVQRHRRFAHRGPDGFVAHVEWLDQAGIPILAEERTIAARVLDRADCWALDFGFTLTNLTGSELAIRSSATKGRDGAGYGGFFWRAPGSATHRRLFTADADSEDDVNGRPAPWVALSGTAADGRDWTLVFVQRRSSDPWFVREREYPGLGPALAWREPLVVDGSVTRGVRTIVADGRLGRDTAAELASRLLDES